MKTRSLIVAVAIAAAALPVLSPAQSETTSNRVSTPWYGGSGSALEFLKGKAESQQKDKLTATKRSAAERKLKEKVASVRQAAEQGDAENQLVLGALYFRGTGVPQNYTMAAEWYRRAAEQGDVWGQFNLADMYINGHGVPQDYAMAAEGYRKAAEQSFAPAQTTLAGMYREGLGVPRDSALALEWYRKAGNQGDAMAQTSMGSMYCDDPDIPRDYVKAVEWYRRGAEQGFVLAQYLLGTMYHQGHGVRRDFAMAAEWYGKAIEKGYADAHHQRGHVHEELQQWDQAIADYSKARDLKPGDSRLHVDRARVYLKMKDYDKAGNEFEASRKLLEAGSHGAAEYNNLAWALVAGPPQMRDPGQALPLVQKALALEAGKADWLNTLGVVYYRLGHFDKAIETLGRAVQSSEEGGTPSDFFFLAMSHHERGQPDRAKEYYEKALARLDAEKQLSPSQKAEWTAFRSEAETLLSEEGGPADER